jgi:hypothetical protein
LFIPSRELHWEPQAGANFRRRVAGLTSAGLGPSENWRYTAKAWNGVLMENPQSLQVILDALLDALRQEIPVEAEAVALREVERKEEKQLCTVSTEPEF